MIKMLESLVAVYIYISVFLENKKKFSPKKEYLIKNKGHPLLN